MEKLKDLIEPVNGCFLIIHEKEVSTSGVNYQTPTTKDIRNTRGKIVSAAKDIINKEWVDKTVIYNSSAGIPVEVDGLKGEMVKEANIKGLLK